MNIYPTCICCSWHAIQPRKLRKVNYEKYHPFDYTHDHLGLKCTLCDSFTCNACLANITSMMNDFKCVDAWHDIVCSYLQNQPPPSPFIGHCCEVKSTTEPRIDEVVAMRYDGYLVIEEFGVMIRSTFCGIDIHGLGKVDGQFPGARHFVIDRPTAIMCEEKNVCARKWDSDFQMKKCFVSLPFKGSKRKQVSNLPLPIFCVLLIIPAYLTFIVFSLKLKYIISNR